MTKSQEILFVTFAGGLSGGLGGVLYISLHIFFGFQISNFFQSYGGFYFGLVGAMAAIMYLNNHPPQRGKGKRQHSSTSIISRIKERIHMPLPRKSCDR